MLAGRFLVLGVIGRGGMGIVVRARDQVTGDEVAVKHVRPDLAEDPDYTTRLVREAQLAKDVSHHNVCRVHDVYPHDDVVLLSMEFVEGETLRALLSRGPLPRAQAMNIARQICAGVAAAHQKGVVHRDLKPENVLIDKNGRVVVLDFGVARKEGTPRETMTGLVQGTPRYMAPEQQQGRAVSPATDVFALGLVIEELFGDRPPPGVRAILRRATERDPQRRYPDAAALGKDLAHPLARRGMILVGAATALALTGALLLTAPGLLGGLLPPPASDPGFAAVRMEPELITRQWGNASFGTISPSGELLAYTETCEDLHNGYLRPLLQKEGKTRQFSDPLHSVSWISFSPDGRRLAYASGRAPTDRLNEIYLVDLAADGSPSPARHLVAGMTPSWFPDGKSLVFSRYSPATGRLHLARVPVDGTSDAVLIDTDPPDDGEVAPVVSPDGSSVAFLRSIPPGGISIVPAEGGKLRTTLALNANYPDRLVWTRDGRYLLYGTPERGLLAVSADGKVGPAVLLAEGYEGRSPSLSRSGDLMVYTRLPDRFDLRVADRDGKNPRTLTLPISAAQISWPLYSSDGRLIAVGMTGPDGVHKVVIPGLKPERSLLALGEKLPEAFVDGDRALIVRNKLSHLEVLSLTAARPPTTIRFADNEVAAAVSPDGLRLATTRTAEHDSPVGNGIWVRDLHDPPERAVQWIPDGIGRIGWSPDGKFLAAGTTDTALVMASGPGQVQRWPLRTADNKPLSTKNVRFGGKDKILLLSHPRVYEFDVHSAQLRPFLSYPGVAYIFGFSVAPDDRDVVFVAQEPTSDVWVLRDFERLLKSRLSGQVSRSR